MAEANSTRLTDLPEYWVFHDMRKRCLCVSRENYRNYGGRGIAVCAEWQSFKAFYRDMGPRPSPKHTIERIDNDGDYEPNNCRWATRAEQLRNTRCTHFITFNGITLCLTDWAKRLGMSRSALDSRLSRGWPLERAMTPRCTGRQITFHGTTQSLAKWAREIGINQTTLSERLEKWPIERALTTPPLTPLVRRK